MREEASQRINIAVVGCGYWGTHLLRNVWDCMEARLLSACAIETRALEQASRRYPGIKAATDYGQVLADPEVEAVVIATPVSTHYEFALQALEAGKHVLVEKPLATRAEEALRLIELAEHRRKVLMVDHTFLYTGAVRWMKNLIASGEMGELLYYDSVRVNLGLIRSDTNVLWDLGPHDFSILDHLCPERPVSVSATGLRHFENPYENIAYVAIRFDTNLIAHFHLNWLAPVKVRTTLIGGTRKMLLYDDMEPSEKVKVYDRGVNMIHGPGAPVQMFADYRLGNMMSPHLDNTEALRLVVRDFVDSIRERRPPLSDGQSGFRVVGLLEAAQTSIEQGGREVKLDCVPTRRC